MGLEVEDSGPKLPPTFSGEAIEVRFPDVEIADPNSKAVTKMPFRLVAFPHWVYKVYLNDAEYEVLGMDLVKGLQIELAAQNRYLQIVDINHKFLYHGMEFPQMRFGRPPKRDDNIGRWKFKRVFYDDGRPQSWEVVEETN